jgi:hypothetical protein
MLFKSAGEIVAAVTNAAVRAIDEASAAPLPEVVADSGGCRLRGSGRGRATRKQSSPDDLGKVVGDKEGCCLHGSAVSAN